jgi:predicted DNA-binding transcriptional regulator AlpA
MKRLISPTELRVRLGNIGRTTLWRLQQHDPDFPKARAITPGRVGFDEAEVELFISQRPLAPGRSPQEPGA